MQIAQISGTASSILGAVSCHGNPWICVWTGPNQETRAANYLRDMGIPHLAPRHEVRLPNRTKRIEPLFRRYIFAQPTDGRIPGELKPNGIAAILRHPSGRAKIVPQWVIDEILARSDDRGIVAPPQRAKFTSAQSVRVLSGPFTSFLGIFELEEDDRVKAMLSIFGRSTFQWFAPEALEAA